MIDPQVAALIAIFCFQVLIAWIHTHYMEYVWWLVIAGQVAGWGGQAMGHILFERRFDPVTDIVAALILNPALLVYTLLFKVGYRAELKRQIDADVPQLLANL